MSNIDDIFESTPQTDEFDKEAWAAKKKAERDEVYALTDATAEAVCADGGTFRDYLDVQATFRSYSATNALLILATKPDARRLGDKDFWRDQGVYIKRQEFSRPIKIVESNGEYTRDAVASACPTTSSGSMTFRRPPPEREHRRRFPMTHGRC